MRDDAGKQVLKDVSRSFYLSLRLLPAAMRESASLGYLLARASDTISDSAASPVHVRMEWLDKFSSAVAGKAEAPRWPVHLLNSVPDVRERRLLECSGDLLMWLDRRPAKEAALVREVVRIITSGQALDLDRFRNATREHPVALPDDAALEDYAWRVAGSVGEFWTKLGLLTMGARFSSTPESYLLEKGIAYGKGLQLVNILRDVFQDLAEGRCYLPVTNPADIGQLAAAHAIWMKKASAWVEDGELYSETLLPRRLRAATVLPALIASETLLSLRNSMPLKPGVRIKVPRITVYRCLFQAFASVRRAS